MRLIRVVVLALALAVHACPAGSPAVIPGADLLLSQHRGMLAGKRIGMVINQTSRLSSGEFLLDALQRAGVTVTALFGPEHGVRGVAAAGEKVGDGIDVKSGVPVYSLYGERNKPTPEMLRNVDLLIYDIQDVGARFYTYISTLKLCMDAAAEHHVPFVVLDRPNPLGGRVDGPLLDDSLRSFVGIGRLPVVYGLTCGELATYMNGMGWLDGGREADLTVVWMDGWNRSMTWKDTRLQWIAPSPNIPTAATSEVYPAVCFLEATNVSEGRGTPLPFYQLGAPFINGDTLAGMLNSRALPGVRFVSISFTPVSSKHAGVACFGVRVELTDPARFRPVMTGLVVISELLRHKPGLITLNHRWLGKLLGKASVAGFLEKGGDPASLQDQWEADISLFINGSSRFLHYPAE